MKPTEKRVNSSGGRPHPDPLLPGAGQGSVSAEYAYPVVEDEISLFYIWRILTRYKWMILAGTVLCTLASALFALLMTPVYRAEVLIAPVTEMDNNSRFAAQLDEFSGIAALAGINMERGGRKNEAIATLKSRLFTEQFIKDEKLLPVLFREMWDEENQRWDDADAEDIPTLGDAYELFDEDVRRIREHRKTGLVVLSIDWENPDEAARWANELVRRVNALLRNKAVSESESAINYVQEQLKQTSVVELRQVLHRLIESEMKEIILAKINEEFAFRVIDPAVAAEEAFKPNIPLLLLFGAMLGILGSVILALFLYFLQAQREATVND
jgi:capsular polysaccharide biosynthesis protein